MTDSLPIDPARTAAAVTEEDMLRTDAIPEDCIVLDTETTGFDPEQGDRLIEIGAVRMAGGVPTTDRFHAYVNPERLVPEAAVQVHGITTEFLIDKPLFHEVADAFLAFVGDLPMVAHNAGFDARFIRFELARIGKPAFPQARFIDAIAIARRKFPGAQANLDALCRRFKISLKDRTVHGALVDAVLLAEVCVELMGGRQTDLFSTLSVPRTTVPVAPARMESAGKSFVRLATAEERARHAAMVATKLGADAIWNTPAWADTAPASTS